jgi:hypothetical protein
MAIQLGALREALIEAGASPEKAAKASEEIASYESLLTKLDGRVNLLTWMVGGVYAVLVIMGAPALWLLLRVAAKVGALG